MRFLPMLLVLLLAAEKVALGDTASLAKELGGTWDEEAGHFFKRGNKPPLDPVVLTKLTADPAVTSMHFDSTSFTFESIQALAASKTLKSLLIVHTDVGQTRMLSELAKIQTLIEIHVGSSSFGDEGLEALCELKNLKSLRLRHVSRDRMTPITAQGLRIVADKLPDLEVFYINLHRMEEAMILELARLAKLKHLMLEEVSLPFLAKVKKVLPNAKVTHTGGKIAEEVLLRKNENQVDKTSLNTQQDSSTIESKLAEEATGSSSDELLWSLQPIIPTSIPHIDGNEWLRTDIDAFVLQKLRENKLAPSDDASPGAFARRLWFVLIGLPPSPEELSNFKQEMLASQGSENTEREIAKWVDRLIESPRFGEKWARHWLDMARYAESNGKALNNGLPFAWRYRDWVINAINSNKPFDRFLTEQIAGDLLPASTQSERDALNIATGFLAIGSKEQFGGCGNRSVAEVQPEWVDDQLNVLGRGILGINVACSRCHDHKFDPVPMRDYYALAGIFFSTEILSGRKGGKAPEFGRKRIFDPDLVLLGDPSVAEKLKPVEERLTIIQNKLTPLQTKVAQAEGKERDQLNVEIDALKSEAEGLRKGLPTVEWAFGVREAEVISNTTIREGGVWDQHDQEVPRGFLSAVKFDGEPKIPATSSGRLQLAEWLTHPRHPLPSRVFVNRVWQQVFGQGIVATTDNFGMNGELPSHPELLDFLAHRFVNEQDWSLKELVRDLVLSRTFRQSSVAFRSAKGRPFAERKATIAIDPANRLLWRMNSRRLDAEAIRDSVLATSGRLDLTPRDGTSPSLMEGLFKGLNQKEIIKLREEESLVRHRAIYLTIIRNESLDETLAVFDYPNNDEPSTQRDTTTVPAQSLLLMNHPLVIESARHLATEIGKEANDDRSRVHEAFIRVLGREPNEDESQAGVQFLQASPESLGLLCQALFQSAEFRLLP